MLEKLKKLQKKLDKPEEVKQKGLMAKPEETE